MNEAAAGVIPVDTSLARGALLACRLFAAWPTQAIESLVAAGRLQRHAAGAQILAHEPLRREVFVVADGCLEMSRANAQGKKFVLGLVGPGEVVGLVRLLPKWPVKLEYYAHRATTLLHLPSDALRAVLDAEPLLWRDIAELSLARHADSVGLLRDLALSPLGERVAATLIDVGRLRGVVERGGMALRLSQDELGAMLGVSRQSVNKELRLLEQAGLIGADYNLITIVDYAGLHQLSQRLR
jgi:CRP-like cAMP-binding protein